MKPKSTDRDIEQEQTLMIEKLFTSLFRLIQAVRIHQENNATVIRCADEFISAIDAFASQEKYISIRIINGRFYLQDEKMNYRREAANLMTNAVHYFEMRKLHGLSFSTDVDHARKPELLAFVKLLNGAGDPKNPSQWFEQELKRANIDWVEILQDSHSSAQEPNSTANSEDRSQDQEQDPQSASCKEAAQKAYIYTLSAVKEISEKVSSGKPGGIRKALRLVQKMIDTIGEDPFVLLGLSTIRNYDDYTYTHSVNVGILAMSLGSHIGLPRNILEVLGICGLFHDLGKTEIPLEIINKRGELTAAEFDDIKKHSLNSARLILRLRASRDFKSQILLGPFEHHLKYDLSGYPQTHRKKPMSLYGRIVAIADVYDALTSPRSYRDAAISPDRALTIMLKGAGKDFDPILLKIFVSMVGIYPVGTLLLLASEELALVIEGTTAQGPWKPRVVLLVPDGKDSYKRGPIVDLSEINSDSGSLGRQIVGTFHPSIYGIQAAQYMT